MAICVFICSLVGTYNKADGNLLRIRAVGRVFDLIASSIAMPVAPAARTRARRLAKAWSPKSGGTGYAIRRQGFPDEPDWSVPA